jgi:hypothetical protein
MVGTPNEVASLQAITFPVAEQTRFYDVWGSDQTYPHFATPWSWAFDSPFKWMKQVASHFGGTRQGMAIAWPKRIKGAGGMRNQFHHVIDIVPTILEATGIPAPSMVNGVTQRSIEGVSMVYTFDKEKADAPSRIGPSSFEPHMECIPSRSSSMTSPKNGQLPKMPPKDWHPSTGPGVTNSSASTSDVTPEMVSTSSIPAWQRSTG